MAESLDVASLVTRTLHGEEEVPYATSLCVDDTSEVYPSHLNLEPLSLAPDVRYLLANRNDLDSQCIYPGNDCTDSTA